MCSIKKKKKRNDFIHPSNEGASTLHCAFVVVNKWYVHLYLQSPKEIRKEERKKRRNMKEGKRRVLILH